MALMDRVKAYFAWNGPNQRIAGPALPWESAALSEFGPGIGNQPTHQALLREAIGIADACTRAIANRVSMIEPVVKRKSGSRSNGGASEEELADHPLKFLLDHPHPNLSYRQLIRLTTQYLVTTGEAYWQKVNDGFGLPTELHSIQPQQIMPLVENGRVIAYRANLGTDQFRDLPPDLIVRFFYPDPENPWGAEGYLGSVSIQADGLKFSNQQLRRFYQKDATPKTVMEASQESTPFTNEQREVFAQDWQRFYGQRSGERVGIPSILPTGYKLVQLAMASGADVTPLLEHWRDDLLMHYGVPRSVLGQVLSGDRSSAETNEWVFEKHTIAPPLELLGDGMTLQLAPEYSGRPVFVDFDEYMTEDKTYTLSQEESDLDRKVKSINEVRNDRSLEPVEWGDDPTSQDASEEQQDTATTEDQTEEDPEEQRLIRENIEARRAYRRATRALKRHKGNPQDARAQL